MKDIIKDLFNNLLCVIFGCKDMVKQRLTLNDEFLETLDSYKGSTITIYECSRCGQLSGGDCVTSSFEFEVIEK